MKTIRWTSAFKSDFKRTMRTPRYREADALLEEIARCLVNGDPVPPRFHDHLLSGNWKGFRECHLYPDLLLIHREDDDAEVIFARMGTHSELFGK